MDQMLENTDVIACGLDGQAYRTRVARIHALMEHALIARERFETAVRLRFRRDAGVEANLEELVALERACCPFLVFALEKIPGEMVLTISGPEGASALLDDAFGGPVACQAVNTPALRRHTVWAVTAGAFTAAFGVATCCALPLALAILGLGTATSLTTIGAWVAPYKGLVSLAAGVGIAAGFLLAYHPRKHSCGGDESGALSGAAPASGGARGPMSGRSGGDEQARDITMMSTAVETVSPPATLPNSGLGGPLSR